MNDYNYGNGYDYDHPGDGIRDSEDTEDASETEEMKIGDYCPYDYEIREQIYRDKLAHLKDQLNMIERGCHPEYLHELEKLQYIYEERKRFIQCCFDCQKGRIEKDFFVEEQAANQEFEDRRIELKESLMIEIDEKEKWFENASNYEDELTYDTVEPKATTTRKLRRRPNDPIPMPDRRRRPSPAHINFLLEDNIITDDYKQLLKTLSVSSKSYSSSKSNNNNSSKNIDYDNFNSFEARIEDGKLFYDKKWFHRGQNILLESADGSKINTMVMQIGNNEIWVRRPNENVKSKVTLAELHSKKYIIQRRS
ncbi:hypothetical protein RDWZM_002631 [Blomia tropicalis]|uniref:Sin3 histone deacetylase corepressor complex component SDS3 n=1 Tax=Blomia tropicalis TaxID=40697 RepID=A0A9Q0MDU2_BLOTA|nr:Sin3 histone deacetylase corepressor complex component SDS3 [Blomia tropicalis]KAJ6224086.1 hypothetical protein RDWZM_002631 [Blomia tropicalis]